MAAGVNRPLKVIAFNANGLCGQCYELSKQLQYLHKYVALLSETHLKPHKRFFIPNDHFYRTDCFPGRKGGTAIANSESVVRRLPAGNNVITKADNIVRIHHQAMTDEDKAN
jgi:hypothetical protein